MSDDSKEEYEKVYNEFKIWRLQNKIVNTTEDVIFNYINYLEGSYAITTIKKKFTIVKTMIKIYEKIDTRNFLQLQAYINKEIKNYTPKKSSALTQDDYNNFMANADDDQYLDVKVSENLTNNNNNNNNYNNNNNKNKE